MAEEIVYDEKEQALQIISKIYELRQTEEHCDFIIRVGNVEILAHRRILMANSEYFKAMLTNDTPENKSGCVVFEDMNAELVKTCVDSMYCKKIFVSEENRENLLEVATKLGMHNLRNQISNHCEAHLSVNSFYNTKTIAEKYSLANLVAKCNEFAVKNFQAIAQLGGFQQLPKKYLSYLLKSKQNPSAETYKVKALMNWTRYDPGNRTSALCEMMQKCDLYKITAEYRRYLLHTELLTRDSLECLQMLGTSAMARLETDATEQRRRTINAIGVFDRTFKDLICINVESGVWKKMKIKHTYLPLSRCTPPCCLSTNKFGDPIHIFFTHNQEHYTLNYSWKTVQWQREQCISLVKAEQAVADVKYIYVTDDTGIVACDPITKTSTVITTCHGGASGYTCVCFKQSIYFIGGRGERVLKVFDITSRQTDNAAPLLNQRSNAVAAVNGEKIYVIGGFTEKREPVSQMDIYCINTNTWTSAKQPLNPGRVINAFAIGNKIFTLSSSGESIIQQYEEESDDWKTVQISQGINLQPFCGAAITI